MTAIDIYLISPLRDMLHAVLGVLPTILAMFVFVVIGVLVAKVFKIAFGRVFKEIHLDKVSDYLGLTKMLHAGKHKHGLSHLLTAVVYLIVTFTFLIMTVRVMGVDPTVGPIPSMIAYLSPVVSAVFIVVLGLILAKIVGIVVHLVVSNLELPNPKLMERISRWAIILYAAKMSLEELGYGFLFSGTVFNIWFAGVILALALAFGLGGRDRAAKYLSRK